MNDRVPIELACFSHIFVKIWESLESCAHAETVVARTFARTHVAPVCHAETDKKGELARTSAFGSRVHTLISLAAGLGVRDADFFQEQQPAPSWLDDAKCRVGHKT